MIFYDCPDKQSFFILTDHENPRSIKERDLKFDRLRGIIFFSGIASQKQYLRRRKTHPPSLCSKKQAFFIRSFFSF